jgi:hypothetical protein
VAGQDRSNEEGNQGQLHCVSDSLNDDGLGSRAEACSRHPRQVLFLVGLRKKLLRLLLVTIKLVAVRLFSRLGQCVC